MDVYNDNETSNKQSKWKKKEEADRVDVYVPRNRDLHTLSYHRERSTDSLGRR